MRCSQCIGPAWIEINVTTVERFISSKKLASTEATSACSMSIPTFATITHCAEKLGAKLLPECSITGGSLKRYDASKTFTVKTELP